MEVWKGLCLAAFLCCVYGQMTQTDFIVIFSETIEAGHDSKLCASLLNPNESVVFSIDLVHNKLSRNLLRERTNEEFHRCIVLQAPEVKQESVQEIQVKVKGQSFEMVEKNKVIFKPRTARALTFIQTDKPVYRPGQTVHFRVVTMDNDFIPFEQQYSTVVLEDVHHNRIAQWTNVSSSGLILQLSHKLNPEAPLGTYTLKVTAGHKVTEENFKVKTYILPRFEIEVNTPRKKSVADDKLNVEVCGKYIFGQPLTGKAWIEVCRRFEQAKMSDRNAATTPFCVAETIQLAGCTSHTFNMAPFVTHKYSTLMHDMLEINVKVTEEGTEISTTKSEFLWLDFIIGKTEFVDFPEYVKRGNLFEGKIRVTHSNGSAVPDKVVYLSEGNYHQSSSLILLQNLTTDMNGLAHFSVDTSALHKSSNVLMASVYPTFPNNRKPHFSYDQKSIYMFLSPDPPLNRISIQVNRRLQCDTKIVVPVKYSLVTEPSEIVHIFITILSKDMIVHHIHEKIKVNTSDGVMVGTFSFPLFVSADLAPEITIVAYGILPSGYFLASSSLYYVEKCLKNKVTLQFSPSEAVAGEENVLQISTAPGSLCALSAVDRSVFMMQPKKQIDKIFDLLPRRFPESIGCEVGYFPKLFRGYGLHLYGALDRVLPLKLATNRYFTSNCHTSIPGVSHEIPDTRTVRKFFPETWIWQLVETGESGSVQVPVTVPDTITTWDTEVFCASPRGLALAPPTHLNVFQPFFLELSLPYSIIRGENFELKATVFNSLPKCIMVKVSATPSSDYTLENVDEQYSSCLCANGRKTFKWTLVPSVLGVLNITVSAEAEKSHTLCNNEIVTVPERGHIDIVTKSLRVEAEGTEKTEVHSWLLCPRGKSVSKAVELRLPPNVTEGSARASVTVLGEILGRTLNNLDRLLKMPFGCGEQNIALMSPNIYILQYLESTKQLTSATQERATELLKTGYQRQLNYKLSDGAYSTFGNGEGNTWLSAFVLRSFGRAQRYIFIDPQNIQHTDSWLISNQQINGCFRSRGTLFNNRMKGGVNDDVTMTAYIIMSFLELGHPITRPVVERGLSCLRSARTSLTNTYTTALLAYTFSLAGDINTRAQLLKDLDRIAISQGDLLHWSQSLSEKSDSLAVEISSYVLLAVLTTSSNTTEDLDYASRIVRWLVTQQNAYGGFFSTQDTVVALQALALYSTKVFNIEGSSTVTVRSAKGETNHFDVNQDNRLLYQEKSLQNIPGEHSIEVSGHACTSVQIALFYNIPTSNEGNGFSIGVKTEGDCKTSSGQILDIIFTVTYNGAQAHTNMVIVDIKLLSGFTAETSSLDILKSLTYVDRVESNDDHVIMYVTLVEKDVPLHHRLQIKQQLPVKDLKPAVIKIYDYYQPSDQSVTEYSSHCV